MANEKDDIGIVRGLAWTAVGGTTLQIEVNTMPGKGVLKLTGQLGDVMKESAHIALSFVRSIVADYGVDKKFFEENDIHILKERYQRMDHRRALLWQRQFFQLWQRYL